MPSDVPPRIGPYSIVEILGEGGMGTVYLADQSEPVRRQVALKVLHPGTDSEQVLARFEAERQSLAVMDHPSIAKIFDAGVTDEGRSYFAMERVEGAPITAYCDERGLSLRSRVELFADVCDAVQHAHQKGIIHRDLKPSNILVSDGDRRPLPRIIDFGIAKATEVADFDGAGLTRDDQVIGTPAYMSPEQVMGSDIDTRADVFALGVVLFELLAGSLPYDRASYRGWAAVAAQLHREPPTIGRRYDALGDIRDRVASQRGTAPSRLRQELSGDLTYMVTKAMEKDRERRYETANALALDLRRYLAHEPVRARGAATTYVLGKFVRRHRAGVAFGATVVAGLIVFSIVTTVQAQRISRARDEADTRRAQAEGLIDFMLSDLREKLEPLGRLEILDDVGAQATAYFSTIPQERFTDDELASRSQSLYQIGQTRLEQGDSEAAAVAFTESLRLARELSDRAPTDGERLFGLSQSHFYVGYANWLAGDLEGAEAEFLGYLGAAERLVALDPEDLDYRLELGFAHSNLGSVREARGDLAGAVDAYGRTLAVQEELVAADPSNIDWLGEFAETYNKIGVVKAKQGDYAGALGDHQEELRVKREILALDPTHAYWRFRSAVAHGFMADALQLTGRPSDGLRLRHEQAAVLDSLVAFDPDNARWRRVLALSHLAIGRLSGDLGDASAGATAFGRAEEELRRLVAVDSTGFGWRFDLASVDVGRADMYTGVSRALSALEAAERALEILSVAPPTTANRAQIVAGAHLARGRALGDLGRMADSRAACEAALRTLEPFTSDTQRTPFRPLLAELYLLLDRPDDARAELDALEASGYVNQRLDALAARKGLD